MLSGTSSSYYCYCLVNIKVQVVVDKNPYALGDRSRDLPMYSMILCSQDHKFSLMMTREISTIVLIKRSASGQVWKKESFDLDFLILSQRRVNLSVGLA